jgi:hypothetical protein
LLAEGKLGDANRIRHQVKAEEVKAMYRKIRSIQGTSEQGLTRLLVPEDIKEDPKKCTKWVLVDLPHDIETHLRARNRKHFGQAKGTPPTMQTFSDHIDWADSTRTAAFILEGDYSLPELISLMQSIVDHMSATVKLDTFPATITVPEWSAKIKIWDECTTTSTSGLHLGHHKALMRPHDVALNTDERKELENQRLALLHGQADLLTYSPTHGHSLNCWKVIINVMLLKEPNNPRIHQLRVIHLYKADFNLLLGVTWRNNIHHSLDQDTLHQNVCLVHARTLQEARCLLKTQLGVSNEFYSHYIAFPIYRTGQGSGKSSMIWSFISSVLFTIHQEKAIGASYISPDKSLSVRLFMIGFFVDDTYRGVSTISPKPHRLHPQN